MKSGVPLERHRAASGRMHTESMRTHEYMHALKKKRQAASREGRKKERATRITHIANKIQQSTARKQRKYMLKFDSSIRFCSRATTSKGL